MEIDDPQESAVSGSPHHRIVQRLVRHGVPLSPGDQGYSSLVAFLRGNKPRLPEVILAILPSDEEITNVPNQEPKDVLAESLLWLQWLMFQAEPQSVLKSMSEGLLGQRAVCGAVWGKSDLAYRCRTCEHDQTCAICVPCFQNGNHKDHDYSIIYTTGGCCDCGDATAWKREGFCSKHKGIEEIQPLPPELANSVGPVLDALFSCWKEKLFRVSSDHVSDIKRTDDTPVHAKITELWTSAIVDMLFNLCQSSESLLCLVSQRIYDNAGLLQLLLRAGVFLDAVVVKKLHELLLKLLGDPLFKYEFAKVFVEYYPVFSQEAVKEAKEGHRSRSDPFSLLSIFSVQIFTVSSLTQRLVNEVDLLSKLFECLRDLFHSCLGDDGQFQARKWYSLYSLTLRLVHDVHFTLGHGEVLQHLAEQKPHVFQAWMRFLALLQGIDGQKRQTDRHIDEENENLVKPFTLTHSIQDINNLMVEGVFAVDGVNETRNDASCSYGMEGTSKDFSSGHQASACTSENNNRKYIYASQPTNINSYAGGPIPDKAIWLISECLRAIENWLESNLPQLTKLTPQRVYKSVNLKKRVHQFRNIDAYSFRKCLHHLTSGRIAKHKRYGTVNMTSHAQGLDTGIESRRELFAIELNCQQGEIMGTSDDHVIDIDSDIDSDGFDLLGSHDWPEIDYDVSTQEVSFHLPLHRFLSLLLRRAMKVYHCDRTPYTVHDFFSCTLGNVHPNSFASFLMEHPLHLRVFCAQVRAGMWKRNGDAGILCCDYYRNAICSEIGIEADLFLLQCCAALSPPELFVIRILERFGLMHYLSLNLATDNEYEVVLVEEMLVLIIQIIVERRFCGLSAMDGLQRELVCKLSVEDSTHSQLVYALPPDLAKHEELQKVIDMVSVYKKPSGTKQGTYSLKKAYWKLLDIYHPRWDIRDLQMAEERFLNVCKMSALDVQLPRWTEILSPLKSITSIATSKTVGKIIRAVLCYSVFSEVPSMCRAPDEVLVKALHLLSLSLEICKKHKDGKADILSSSDPTCMDASNFAEDEFPLLMFATEIIGDSVAEGSRKKGAPAEGPVFIRNQSLLSLLVLLMKKRKEECAMKAAYMKVCNIPSLVKSLLNSFAQLSSGCLNELQKLAPEVFSHLERSSSNDSNSLKLSSGTRDQKSKARERQAAILERMKSEQSKFLATLDSESMDEVDISGNNQERNKEHLPVCCLCHDTDSKSPIMILVLLQKSRISSLFDKGPPLWQENNDSEKDSIVDDILHNHSPEISVDSDIEPPFDFDDPNFDELDPAPNAPGDHAPNSSSFCDTKMSNLLFIEALENSIAHSIQNDIKEADYRSDRILANEKNFLSSLSEGMNDEYIGDSSADERVVPCELLKYFSCSMEIQQLADLPSTSTSNQFGLVDCDGMHLSSCGHAVHQECYGRYLSSLRQRYQRRLNFEGGRIVDPNMDELLCPVCRRFSNSALPVVSNAFIGSQERILSDNNNQNQTLSPHDIIMSNDKPLLRSDMNATHPQLKLALSVILSSSEVIRRFRLPKAFPERRNAVLDSALEPILHKLSAVYYPQEQSDLPSSENLKMNDSLMLWDTLRYSIISTEIASRGRNCKDINSGNGCLLQDLSSSSEHILAMLLQVALVTRMLDHVSMLLRFEGIGLFASSIFSGFLGKGGVIKSNNKESHLSSFLDSGKGNLGIHFRKFASGPIITHDPFSSLIWVLFSLPHPFISSSECFISLVYLFYIVCVVQALISCYAKRYFEASNIDGLLNSICKTVSRSDHARNFFVSSFVDDSCNLKDTVRRLTFPYLRRSALLWRLLRFSVPPMHYSNSHAIDDITSSFDTQPLDTTENVSAELSGIIELENMFKIGSLELVYRDETVHALALVWCKHFIQHCRASRLEYVLTVSPAVPFKLMQLPLLYQDLLQRYLGQPCPSCHHVLEDPALCLLCGRLCSGPRKRCCRPSWCRTHATTCGSGIGVFLLIKTTLILLQRSARQSIWPSPYLDAYGEEDTKMSRGKPLYLNEERYTTLTKMVASHSLDQSSEVLRRTTTIFDL